MTESGKKKKVLAFLRLPKKSEILDKDYDEYILTEINYSVRNVNLKL